MRSSAVKRIHLSSQVLGSDRIWLVELSLLGSIARVPEVLLFPRRGPDYANAERSLIKNLGPTLGKRSALYLHLSFFFAFERAILSHIENRPEKLVYALSILMAFLTTYNWQLGWMRSGRRTNRPALNKIRLVIKAITHPHKAVRWFINGFRGS